MNFKLEFLIPKYHFSEHHSLSMNGNLGDVFLAVESADLSDSLIAQILMTVWRSIAQLVLKEPPKRNMSVGDFALLKYSPPNFIARGLIGGKNRPRDIHDVTAESFMAFNISGSIKLVWAFWLEDCSNGSVCVHTETRVYCTDNKTKLYFSFYWYLIRPWSGLIRRRMLVAIKRGVERQL